MAKGYEPHVTKDKIEAHGKNAKDKDIYWKVYWRIDKRHGDQDYRQETHRKKWVLYGPSEYSFFYTALCRHNYYSSSRIAPFLKKLPKTTYYNNR